MIYPRHFETYFDFPDCLPRSISVVGGVLATTARFEYGPKKWIGVALLAAGKKILS